MYQHDPRHVDVLVKDLGLEQGNYVQTPATHDVIEEEPEPLDQVQQSNSRLQVCKMFVAQSRSNIKNIHRERVVKDCQTPHNRVLAS